MSLSVLNPDQIVGRWFASVRGLRGFVKYRFSLTEYCVSIVRPDDTECTRLLTLEVLSGCRFFDSKAAMESATSGQYFAAAQLAGEQP